MTDKKMMCTVEEFDMVLDTYQKTIDLKDEYITTLEKEIGKLKESIMKGFDKHG